MRNHDLESRFFYRLVKVVYFLFLFLALILAFYFGYGYMPTKYVDNDKSYLVCPKGLYTFNSQGIQFWVRDNDENKFTSNNFDEKAKKSCSEYVESDWELADKPPEMERAEKMRKEFISNPNHGPFTVSLEIGTEGSWKKALEWWLGGGGLIYIILNIIKETLVYLAFGKKFTWDWIFFIKKDALCK
jgi:hypothetical protein